MIDSYRLRRVLLLECDFHPAAELVDFYKLCFQGIWGPAHALDNRQQVETWLRQELEVMRDNEKTQMQDIGIKVPVYRVPLSLVKQGQIPLETVLDAFIESKDFFPVFDDTLWRNLWASIQLMLDPGMNDSVLWWVFSGRKDMFYRQSEFIEKNLALGSPVFHHSEQYRALYNPHYRIVSEVGLNRYIKPMWDDCGGMQ